MTCSSVSMVIIGSIAAPAAAHASSQLCSLLRSMTLRAAAARPAFLHLQLLTVCGVPLPLPACQMLRVGLKFSRTLHMLCVMGCGVDDGGGLELMACVGCIQCRCR